MAGVKLWFVSKSEEGIFLVFSIFWCEQGQALGGFPSGLVVKNQPAMQEVQETQVQSPGREDPLEEGMTTHFIFLPGEFHGQRSLAGYSP